MNSLDGNTRKAVVDDVGKQFNYIVKSFLDAASTLPWMSAASMEAARNKGNCFDNWHND